jgi:hypothetical protein
MCTWVACPANTDSPSRTNLDALKSSRGRVSRHQDHEGLNIDAAYRSALRVEAPIDSLPNLSRVCLPVTARWRQPFFSKVEREPRLLIGESCAITD